jgi:hypothetical protein
VKSIIDLLRQRPVNTLDPGQVLDTGPGHFFNAPKMLQQLLTPPRANSRDPLQR